MVSNTRKVDLTNAWKQVSLDAATECSITLEGNRAFQAVVQIQTDAPGAADAEGHRLTALSPSCPVSGLAPTQKVFARALNGAARLFVS